MRALVDESAAAGLRIALVLATSAGGVGRHVAAVAGGLAAGGYDVAVLGPAATERRFAFSREGAANPVRFRAVEIGTTPNPLAALHSVFRLRRLTRSTDVLHAHGLRAAIVATCATGRLRPRRGGQPDHGRRRGGPALVVTLHNAMLGNRLRRAAAVLVMRWVAACADAVLAVSPDLVDQLRPATPAVRRAQIAAPVRSPTRDRETMRRLLGIGPGCRMVLAIGRLHPQKGFDVLVRVAAQLRDAGHHVCFVVAGDGPERHRLAAAIERAGVDVRLLGDRLDVADLVQAADVVVMPSRWEGWPLTAGEVLAAGVPLVASRVGGLPELVGDAAVLVPPDDPIVLATAVESVLVDAGHAAELAAAGRRRAAELPTDDDVIAQLVGCYAAVGHRP